MKRRWILALAGLALLAAPPVAEAATSPYVVVLKDTVTDPAAVAAAQGQLLGFQATQVYGSALKGYAAPLSSTQLSSLRLDSRCRPKRDWP